MANIVVTGGIITCSHQGRVRFTSGDSRLEVDGNAAIVRGQEAGISFAPSSPGLLAPCTFTSGANPSPCTATMPATTGISAKLTVGNLGVLLDTANGNATNPNDPSATWSIDSAGQSKLETDE